MASIKLLTFTTLFPSSARPNHGVFVKNRLWHLLQSGQVESVVVAPVPWFPCTHRLFGSYGQFARTPHSEIQDGLTVYHPRYPVLPKIGMAFAPALMACALVPILRKVEKSFSFDIIDAHYFYPDGVAAVALGRMLKKPVVVTARGTDLNVIPQFMLPRKQIQWAAKGSAAVITVCKALKDKLIDLGIKEAKIHPLRNGVNLDLFHPPQNRLFLKERLGLTGPVVLSVGQLVKNKGHDLVIRSLTNLSNTTLLVVGSGPERFSLQKLAQILGITERVRFVGNIPHNNLVDYYSIADVVVLASSREGWPNVLLESIACGTPVVVSNVGGVAEIVCSPEAGILVEKIEPENFAKAIHKLLINPPNREATRKYAEQFSWDATTQGQLNLFKNLLARNIQ